MRLLRTTGSPPRVWGMPLRRFLIPRQARFTPTCVGNAWAPADVRLTFAVHPHVCGECASPVSRHGGAGGSPPRVWGMRYATNRHRDSNRFTPTCVGNARPRRPHTGAHTVHPHVCGECLSASHFSSSPSGSPPRVWGMRQELHGERPRPRFTPTCVGNARAGISPAPSGAVHPHVCGECTTPWVNFSGGAGSPPRVWGMRVAGADSRSPSRFTPTCVGNARPGRSGGRGRPVHPHVCGECASSGARGFAASGSPPRVWGMLPQS